MLRKEEMSRGQVQRSEQIHPGITGQGRLATIPTLVWGGQQKYDQSSNLMTEQLSHGEDSLSPPIHSKCSERGDFLDQEEPRHRLIAWLLHMPTLDRIARSLVLDYLSIFKPIQATIYRLNQDDSITCLAAYGIENPTVGASTPSSGWRTESETTTQSIMATATKTISWSDENRRAVINLYVQSILIGFMVLRFANSVLNVDEFGAEVLEISWYISLYINFHSFAVRSLSHNGELADEKGRKVGQDKNTRLSDRQKQVLTGISEGKTNNMIANELGYSVSTIRHETMKIFEVFGVSNRVEAASHATTLGLI